MLDRNVDLKELNKEELIELVNLLLGRVSTLEKQVAELKSEGKKSVKKTSRNSSIPPSRDQKSNITKKQKAKRGPKCGHQGNSRRRTKADEIIECRVTACEQCGMDLSQNRQWLVGRHQVIDVPPVRPIVSEARRYRTTCPHCHHQQTADYVTGFERGRVFGRHLEQMVLYLHYAHPLSYERVQRIVLELFGLKITQGALVNMVKRAQPALTCAAAAIHQQIKQSVVIGSDETTARIDGTKYWQWVFQTPDYAYYVIRPSRAAQVIADVMGDAQPQVWVSDVFSSQMCHPAQHYQICLAHQVRDLQYAIDTHQCHWAQQVQTVFEDAMHLHRQRDQFTATDFACQRDDYEATLDTLLQVVPDNIDSETLRGRYTKHRSALLLFLHRHDVPPTNNASERALRNSVIYRKVTGGFRTDWGAELYADLVSVLETARRQGRSIFETLSALLAGHDAFSVSHSL